MLRAVFYCRCSTEEESQADALKKQVLESEACIREQGWQFAGSYVESKSGTTTKGRKEYHRLYEDLLTSAFDIIVIKSQDRLMRNVKDWYLFLDRMLTQGKRLFIYLEKKFYSADDALLTGIKAILAEEYSRELSKKINHAHQNRQKNGGKVMLNSRVFGFCKKSDGSLIVVEEEAEIIHKMYSYCAVGYGSRRIANIFLEQGFVKRTGHVLTASAIRKIIRNPLYMGTMVMNRRHYDFETKRTIVRPEKEWIYGQGIVPAIIEPALWEEANLAMDRRARNCCCSKGYSKENLKSCIQYPSPGSNIQYLNPGETKTKRYALSGKLVCANCGKLYYRTCRPRYKDKEKENLVIEWKCSNYLEKGRISKKCSNYLEKGRISKESQGGLKDMEKSFLDGCDNIHLEENIVFSLLGQVMEKYYDNKEAKDSIMQHAVQILRKILRNSTNNREGKEIDEGEEIEKEEKRLMQQKDFLLDKFIEGVIADKDYRRKDNELEENLLKLQQRKEKWNQKKQKEKEQNEKEQKEKEQKEKERKEKGWEKKSLEQRIQKIKDWMDNGGIEKAAVIQMLEDIREIRVHEWQLELCFDFQKGISIPYGNSKKTLKDTLPREFTLWVDYPFAPETQRGRYLDRREIMELLKNSPSLTAKEIAEKMGRSVYMVRNRIVELNRGGYLYFHGKGGHGEWVICRELPDKEESFKNGGCPFLKNKL